MRTFRDWDAAHEYYTKEYDLNHVANTSHTGSMQRLPSPAPVHLEPPVPNPTTGTARAQSAPPLIPTAGTGHGPSLQTPLRPTVRGRCGTLWDCGSPNHPIYVKSAWPTPVVTRPTVLPPVPQAAPQVPVQPALPVSRPPLLPTILERMETAPRPLTQLHFDKLGRLIHPGAVSVPSSPDENDLPPVRKPQPFPFIPDPDFFTYPARESRGTQTVELSPALSFPASTPSGEALPETPFLGTPSRSGLLFFNLSPCDRDSVSVRNKRKTARPDSESEAEDIQECAATLFHSGITPTSASTAKCHRGTPVASSSKTAKPSKKRGSPSTPASKTPKATKARKTPSKRTRVPPPLEDEDAGYASLYTSEPQ